MKNITILPSPKAWLCFALTVVPITGIITGALFFGTSRLGTFETVEIFWDGVGEHGEPIGGLVVHTYLKIGTLRIPFNFTDASGEQELWVWPILMIAVLVAGIWLLVLRSVWPKRTEHDTPTTPPTVQ